MSAFILHPSAVEVLTAILTAALCKPTGVRHRLLPDKLLEVTCFCNYWWHRYGSCLWKSGSQKLRSIWARAERHRVKPPASAAPLVGWC